MFDRRGWWVWIFVGAGCAAPSQKAFDELRAERAAEMKAFKDEIQSEIAQLRQDMTQLRTAQTELEGKQRELAEAAPEAPSRPAPQRPDPKAVYAVPVGDAPVLGPDNAWITIVEISDFQCPFCARAQGTLAEIRDVYRDDVRIVFKHNPLTFHQRAMPAAIAAECAGEQGRFWEMHDAIFDNQRALEDEDLERYAAQLPNFNERRWKKCVAAKRPEDKILSDQRYATQIGARGTPTFYVNGRVLPGAQPFEAFRRLIEEELDRAKASGIPRADYYERAVAESGRKEM